MESPDHDLLIELRADIKAMRLEIADIKDNIKATLDDHETRIRMLETSGNQNIGRERIINGSIALLAAAVIDFVLSKLK